jgi:hypothetical protein
MNDFAVSLPRAASGEIPHASELPTLQTADHVTSQVSAGQLAYEPMIDASVEPPGYPTKRY